jgi:hypothetical protein
MSPRRNWDSSTPSLASECAPKNTAQCTVVLDHSSLVKRVPVSREAELGQLEARAQAAHLERLLYRARLQSRYIIIIHSIYNNVHRSCKYVQ